MKHITGDIKREALSISCYLWCSVLHLNQTYILLSVLVKDNALHLITTGGEFIYNECMMLLKSVSRIEGRHAVILAKMYRSINPKTEPQNVLYYEPRYIGGEFMGVVEATMNSIDEKIYFIDRHELMTAESYDYLRGEGYYIKYQDSDLRVRIIM